MADLFSHLPPLSKEETITLPVKLPDDCFTYHGIGHIRYDPDNDLNF
jgi:hypothetical protein